ncbi:MAG: hypothetical protein ACKO72_09015 [Actinomycetes bacterium]
MESDAPLPDGTYAGFIVDANTIDDDLLAVDVTITSGPHRGELLTLRARGLTRRDPIHLMGRPCDLIVTDGAPRIEL